MKLRRPYFASSLPLLALATVAFFAGYHRDGQSVSQRSAEARKLASEIHIHFTAAANASDLAVMTDTDAASVQFAGQARASVEALEKDAGALQPVLADLQDTKSSKVLERFWRQLASYGTLGQSILDLHEFVATR